jgi:hypothetical protein
MATSEPLAKLRQVITENLRIQRSGAKAIPYIDVTNAIPDTKARQNHVVFGRRGCGKTLLFENARATPEAHQQTIYLNFEDFKNHSFPNVLLEIVDAVFKEVERHYSGWFLVGKKRKARNLIASIRAQLAEMKEADDERFEKIVEKQSSGTNKNVKVGYTRDATDQVSATFGSKAVGAEGTALSKLGSNFSFTGGYSKDYSEAIERAYERADSKIQKLNRLLPKLKDDLRHFFEISSEIKALFIQLDDFYHLRREHQPYIMDYIHRLCKDLPLYFKVATLRHASVLYAERKRQPVGAQERHDYQPIDIDFTFQNFPKTEKQILDIFHEFANLAGMSTQDFDKLFKGDGFRRLVLAGGGIPRDCLSLFLQAPGMVSGQGAQIGKDDIRQLSFSNFERKIEDLKRDSQTDEQDTLLKGIYVMRQFCLDSKTNIFFVPDRLLQEHEMARELIFRLLDYRIIHSVGAALTHKSHSGSYQGFMIDIGCYAHMRKLEGKMTEIDLSSPNAKEQMRSVPILSAELLEKLWKEAPARVTSQELVVQRADDSPTEQQPDFKLEA